MTYFDDCLFCVFRGQVSKGKLGENPAHGLRISSGSSNVGMQKKFRYVAYTIKY